MNRRGPAAACLAAALAAAPVVAQAQGLELTSRTELRVCADPSNLPFSNDKQQGFENKIADVIGQDLGLPVSYTWFPQVVGFVRRTLGSRACDVVMGTVSGDTAMETTSPYYHTGYMIVTRPEDRIAATALGDAAFTDKKFGLIAATPPTDLLLRHKLMDHTSSYSLVVDTRYESPSRQMLQDLLDKKIDVALLWGPIAGYYVTHEHMPLTLAFLEPETGAPRLDFHIAMGVRAGETEWRRRINQALHTTQDRITKILVDYGIPLLDEQNHPVANLAQ